MANGWNDGGCNEWYNDGANRSAYGRNGQPGHPQAPYGYQAQPYSQQGSPYAQPPRRRHPVRTVLLVLLAIVCVCALAAGVWFGVKALSTMTVSVNGVQVELKKGATVQTLLDEGHAAPQGGNLLAIDGSVLTPGGGTPYAAAVNGTPCDATYALTGGEQVVIDNGSDVTEDVVVSEETVPRAWYDDSREFSSYWAGSIHLMGDGQDGMRTVKTGSVSGLTQVEETTPAQSGGYRVYTAQVDRPVIALTFDDGPWPDTTSQILDILETYGARATFFTIGNQIPGREDLVRRARDLGCEVCTHTWDHAAGSGEGVNITYMSAEEQVNEVLQGYAAIADALGEEPTHIMRAPGGNFYGDTIDILWPYVTAEIGWNVDTEDWRRPGADVIAQRIMAAQPGQVVLMHDGGGDRSQTVEALRQALPALIEQGYEFVTVSELIAMSQAQGA